MDNKVNDLCYAVKFENHGENKNNFFIKHNIFFFKPIFFILGKVFFLSLKNSIASAIFLPRQILKNIVMPQQKPQQLLTAKANSER